MSAIGTKRNYLGAHGISGAEGRPAVPSTWRRPRLDELRRGLRRERELKRGPLWYVRLSPDSSPVRFDNRAADR